MQDFSEPDPEKMNYEVLAKQMRFLKEQEEDFRIRYNEKKRISIQEKIIKQKLSPQTQTTS